MAALAASRSRAAWRGEAAGVADGCGVGAEPPQPATAVTNATPVRTPNRQLVAWPPRDTFRTRGGKVRTIFEKRGRERTNIIVNDPSTGWWDRLSRAFGAASILVRSSSAPAGHMADGAVPCNGTVSGERNAIREERRRTWP
ncbi:hypothetical protein GCM10009681_19540 [Luedemannella helvata]|uniref:Uncharacterized protein n=1 Tax=Luedemannella helvata TaxID=349315 RepID=A0ABN2K4T1_9ACTN